MYIFKFIEMNKHFRKISQVHFALNPISRVICIYRNIFKFHQIMTF